MSTPLDCGCVVDDETGMLSKACDPHFAEFTIDIGQVMIDNLRAEVAALRALLARAAEVLEYLEWKGCRGGKTCLNTWGCGRPKSVGHRPDCDYGKLLAAVLREIEGKGEA